MFPTPFEQRHDELIARPAHTLREAANDRFDWLEDRRGAARGAALLVPEPAPVSLRQALGRCALLLALCGVVLAVLYAVEALR